MEPGKPQQLRCHAMPPSFKADFCRASVWAGAQGSCCAGGPGRTLGDPAFDHPRFFLSEAFAHRRHGLYGRMGCTDAGDEGAGFRLTREDKSTQCSGAQGFLPAGQTDLSWKRLAVVTGSAFGFKDGFDVGDKVHLARQCLAQGGL